MINSEDVVLCPVTPNDYELILAWRNNRKINFGFYSQATGHEISWEEHVAWLKSRNEDWLNFMIWFHGRRIGAVTIGNLDHWAPEIGYYIGEITLWGQGIGTEAVRNALYYLWSLCGKKWARTTIIDENAGSIRVCEKLGFKKIGPARPGESWYQTDLQLLFAPPKQE
ncbi:MAG: GNAT family N-acetyltransferase [Dehalococcoidia bacterium]|nr:GNAT family N-acetyltransferase [Dehalococcoidia bacterium]